MSYYSFSQPTTETSMLAANDNESEERKKGILEVLNRHFQPLHMGLYQGRLVGCSQLVATTAKNKNISLEQLGQLIQEHEMRVKAGVPADETVEIIQEALGSQGAATAFVVLHAVREMAFQLILADRGIEVAQELPIDTAPRLSFQFKGSQRSLKNSLTNVLVQVGGLSVEDAQRHIRRFEIDAQTLLDHELGKTGPSIA